MRGPIGLMISWDIGQFQKTKGPQGCDRQYIIWESEGGHSRFSTSVDPPAVPEGGNGVFLRAGRREHVEARKKWVPQIKLPVAGTWRPLRKIREPVTTSHAPPCSHCAGKCPL